MPCFFQKIVTLHFPELQMWKFDVHGDQDKFIGLQ